MHRDTYEVAEEKKKGAPLKASNPTIGVPVLWTTWTRPGSDGLTIGPRATQACRAHLVRNHHLLSCSTCSTMSTSNVSTTQYQQLQLKLSAKVKETELLQQQLARLNEDVEDLRQDKKYLRAHNDDLKGELTRLRDEIAAERKEKDRYRALVKQLQGHVPSVLRVGEGACTVKSDPGASSDWNSEPGASSFKQTRSPSLEIIDMDTTGPDDINLRLSETTQDLDVDLLELDPMRSEADGQTMGGRAEGDIQEPLTPASQTPGPSAKALGKRKQVDDGEPQPTKKAKAVPFSSLPDPPWLKSKANMVFRSPGRDPTVLGPAVTPANLFEAYPASLSRPQPACSTTTSACSASGQGKIWSPGREDVQPQTDVVTELTVPSAHQQQVLSKPPSTPIPSPFQNAPLPVESETPTPTTATETEALSPPPVTGVPTSTDEASSAAKDAPARPIFQPEEEEEDEEEAQRPNFKVKEEQALTLPASVVEAYLQDAPKYIINPPAHPVGIPRIVMRLSYGGSDQHLIQYIPEDKNPSGNTKRRCVYPMPDMNPAMPFMPGESGLLFASRPELVDDNKGPWSVFRREKKAMWVYLGEYQNTLVGKLTKEQFCWQKETVQNHWANLVSKKRSPKYSSMRARIALRKAGILPVDDKVKETALVHEEQEKAKSGKGHPVNEKDILEAFRRGDEGIEILRMKCVGYDHVFIDHIAQQFKKYKEDKVAKQREQEKRMLPANHPARSQAVPGVSAVQSTLSTPSRTPIPSASTSTRVTRSQAAATSQQPSISAVAQAATVVASSPGPSAPPRVTRSQKVHQSTSISTSKPRAPAPSTPVPSVQAPTRPRPPTSSASSTTSESAVAMELQVGPDPSPESSYSRWVGSTKLQDSNAAAGSQETGIAATTPGLGSSLGLRNWDWTRVYSWDGEKAIAQRAEEEEEEDEDEPVDEPMDQSNADSTEQTEKGYESDGGLSYASCVAEEVPPLPPPAPVVPVARVGVTTRARSRKKAQDADSGYLSAVGNALSDVSDLTDLDDL